jgi:hypothetical protein
MRNSLAALLALSLTSCALIRSGTSQVVEFTSEPDGATFVALGKQHTTPVELELPKDDYKFVFTKEGYEDKEVLLTRQVNGYFIWSVLLGLVASSIDILTGAWKEFVTTKVHAVLVEKPEVPVPVPTVITSEPPGAEVSIDGATVGRTTLRLTLKWWRADGDKTLTFRLSEYKTRTVKLPRLEPALHVALEEDPVTASVIVRSVPADAEVWLGGRRLEKKGGAIDLVWRPRQRSQIVELKLDGYAPQKVEVARGVREVDAGALAELEQQVTFAVKVSPAEAQVEVDGARVAVKDGRLTLPWRSSRASAVLRVSHPGFVAEDVTVTRESAATPVEVRLKAFLPKSP